jgi:hypothetical protein
VLPLAAAADETLATPCASGSASPADPPGGRRRRRAPGLALLIGTVGLRVQTWADPQAFLDGL